MAGVIWTFSFEAAAPAAGEKATQIRVSHSSCFDVFLLWFILKVEWSDLLPGLRYSMQMEAASD